MLGKIQKLKELFDHSSAELQKDYWNKELLEAYAETLGERIRWKWDAFLKSIKDQSIDPESILGTQLNFYDWGCGPGTASLAVAESLRSKQHFDFFDRSTTAIEYSRKRLAPLNSEKSSKGKSVLLLSYVLSELSKNDEAKLIEKIFAHDAFMWVDAGTHKESRRMANMRNTLASHFDFLWPCPHSSTCPLSGEKNSNDWCHLFAEAPQEVFHSAKWSEISKVLKIDLRSLPYAALYAVKKNHNVQIAREDKRLARPRVGKHEITLDYCTTKAEYEHRKITKRDNPELFKKLRKE